MLKFFSINDVFRLLFVYAILLVFRITFIVLNDQIMVTELSHLVIGQKMGEGMLIYKSIIDFTAPLSALVYHIVYLLFGKSYLALQVFALFFLILQSFIFNYWVNRLELLTEKSYFPALLFVGVASCSIEFMTLTPMLMATSFYMMAIFKVLEVIKHGDNNAEAYQAGIYLGLGVLFYSPLIVSVIPLGISLLAYSGIKPKKYIIYGYGVIFPLLLVGVFFYWKRSLLVYLVDIVYYAFSLSKGVYVTLEGVLISFSFVLIISIVGFQKGLFSQRFINYQRRAIAVGFFNVIGLILIGVLSPGFNYSLFYFLVPIAAYYISILFDVKYIKRKTEIGFVLVVLLLFFTGFVQFFYSKPYENLTVRAHDSKIKGKVLVLGDDISIYANNDVVPTTGFMNWKLSKRYFEANNDKFQKKVKSFIDRDTPHFIIDQEQKISFMKEYVWFKDIYNESSDGVFVLRK